MNGGFTPSGGGSFDPHSPGPIGDVTPSTISGSAGSFTALTLPSTSSGISVVNSSDGEPSFTFGTYNAISGVINSNANCFFNAAAGGVAGANQRFVFGFNRTGTSGGADILRLERGDGAYVTGNLALRNGTAGQTFSVYATFTDDSNFSKFSVDCSLGSGAGVFFTIGQTGSGASTMDFYNFDKPMQFGGGVSKTTGGASVVGDGTYTPVASITILGGLVTAIS